MADMNQKQNENEVVAFAYTNFRNMRKKFGIMPDDRRRHMYVIGKTGMGKSTLIENMVIQDIRNGKGIALVDPLGDLVERILKFIPPNRINDVVYFNPADFNYPLAFNVLESIDPTHHHLVTSGLIAVFKKIWVDSWGPRLEYVLRNTILSLLEYPGSTLLGVTRMLVDKKFRQKVVDKITDPIVKAFWLDEFNAYSNQFRTEAVSPIQNKVGQFLSSSVIRNIVGQSKSTIDMRNVMDSGKILLMNLAKGRIGEDNASLLGAMMITKLQLAAMSRVDTPEAERRDFYLYVDEFQNFATESFATILSEARKYRLNLVIAHQYIEQLDETVRAAVFGNVGTIVVFRVGAADAEFLVKEFEPVFTETDLVNLTKYDVYLRLMIDGVASDPFSATTLPPLTGETDAVDKVIFASRERYANNRTDVEEKITRWSGVEEMYRETAAASNEDADRRQRIRQVSDERPHRRTPPPSVSPRIAEAIEQEQAAEPEPAAISLAEAVKSAPVAFSGKPRIITDTPRPSQRRDERPPQRQQPERRERRQSGHQPRSHRIEPGQVVQF